MSLIEIRKRSLTVETIYHEGGPVAATPLRLAAACAVIRNPYAGRYEQDLLPFMGNCGRSAPTSHRNSLRRSGRTRSRSTARPQSSG